MAYAAWLPLQPAFTRLLAATAGPILRLVDRPPLVSRLVAQGDAMMLYSFLTGFREPMASWSTETIGVFLLAPLVVVLAAPVPRLRTRAVALPFVLGAAFMTVVAISVVQIRLIVNEHATGQLDISVLTAKDHARLVRLNDGLHVVGMLALPAALFLATYAWGRWLSPAEAVPVDSRRLRGVLAASTALLFAATAIGLAAVPAASTDPADYHEGWGKVLRLNPSFAPAQVNVALHLEQADRIDEAIALYRTAVDSRPDLLLAHYNLANALSKQQRDEEAVASFREVLRIDGNHAGAHRNLGLALARLNRSCEATRHLDESARLDASARSNAALLREIERLRAACDGR